MYRLQTICMKLANPATELLPSLLVYSLASRNITDFGGRGEWIQLFISHCAKWSYWPKDSFERIRSFGEKLKAFTEWWRIPLVFIFGQKFNLAGLSVKITDLRNRQELKITLILRHDLRLISFLHEINAKRRISVDPFFFFLKHVMP